MAKYFLFIYFVVVADVDILSSPFCLLDGCMARAKFKHKIKSNKATYNLHIKSYEIIFPVTILHGALYILI